MTNILVTGASGFIGRPLVELLLEKGNYVKAACRSKFQIESLDNDVNYKWYPYDLTDTETDYVRLLEDIDVIIHLAAQVHIMTGLSKEKKDGFRLINAEGTEILAKVAAKSGVKRFVFLSTIKVNGEESNGRMIRVKDTPNPQDSYAMSKHSAEKSLIDISKGNGMEFVIIRTPLVYGPGVRANFLRLIKIVSKGYPLPFRAINNLRSLIYVKNLADIILICAEAKNAENKTYLVKDIDISTPDLIRAIAHSFGVQANLFPLPRLLLKIIGIIMRKRSTVDRLTDSLVIDDSPLRNELAWEPPYTLEEALENTINWYREIQKG